MSGWTAVHLDAVEAVPWQGGDLVWHPVRLALGTRIVGMGAYTAPRVGQVVIEGHAEGRDGRGHEEVYVVLRGRATFTLDGATVDAPAGTFVAVTDPAVHRGAVAAEPDTAVLALGGDPVFVPGDSEWVERARPHLRSDPERVARILDEMRAEKPEGPAREVADAFGALVARRPDVRGAIESDPDLAPLLR